MSAEERCSREFRCEPVLPREFMFWRERFAANRSWARLLCEMARCGIAGVDSDSTISSLTRWRLVADADLRTCLPPEGKYPDRWFGAGEVGEDSTDEASVRVVSRDPTVDARDRLVEALWSESSAEE